MMFKITQDVEECIHCENGDSYSRIIKGKCEECVMELTCSHFKNTKYRHVIKKGSELCSYAIFVDLDKMNDKIGGDEICDGSLIDDLPYFDIWIHLKKLRKHIFLDEIKKFKHVLNDEHFHYPYDCPSCIAYISFIIMKLHLYDKEKKLEDISFKNRLDDIICTINPKRFKAIKLANNNITI